MKKMTMNRPYDPSIGRITKEQDGARKTSIPKVVRVLKTAGIFFQQCGGGKRVIKASHKY